MKNGGDPIEYKGSIYYSFPTVEQLKNATEEKLKACGVGFRAKYIKDTVNKIYENSVEQSEQYKKRV